MVNRIINKEELVEVICQVDSHQETGRRFGLFEDLKLTGGFLELFFENLLLDAGHEMKNRYMRFTFERDTYLYCCRKELPVYFKE